MEETLMFEYGILISYRLDYFGFNFLSDGVFEPLSAAALLFFGISYYGVTKKESNVKKVVAIWTPITFIPLLDSFTIILLLAVLGIFVWLAAKSKDIRSFQFQISIFIIIWVLGQVAGSLQTFALTALYKGAGCMWELTPALDVKRL